MILRRISEGIKNQDWFVVGVEVMIVVVGIFVGLQVTEWNQSRKDRVEEQIYIERLKSDLKETIILQSEDIENGTQGIKDQIFVFNTLNAGTLDPGQRQKFGVSLGNVGQVIRFRTIKNTIDELKSTGKMTLIQSNILRQEISRYDEFLRAEQNSYTITNEPTLFAFNELTLYFTYVSEALDQPEYTEFEFETLLKNPVFNNRVAVTISSNRVNLERLKGVLAETQKMLAILEENT